MDIPRGDQSYTYVNRIQLQIITKTGWDVQIKRIDQITVLVPLHLIKESNPIELSEHDKSNSYSNEPAFIWWVRKVLDKCDRLVNKVKSRCQNNIFKFEVEVPLTVGYALNIDQ